MKVMMIHQSLIRVLFEQNFATLENGVQICMSLSFKVIVSITNKISNQCLSNTSLLHEQERQTMILLGPKCRHADMECRVVRFQPLSRLTTFRSKLDRGFAK